MTTAPTRPATTPLARAITIANLTTETAVLIGGASIAPAAITVSRRYSTDLPYLVEVQCENEADADTAARVFALPEIEWSPALRTWYWEGVSLAGDSVVMRVFTGRTA